jgi:ABC-2 type transport system ATP-binding protein
VNRHCPERTIVIATEDDGVIGALREIAGVDRVTREGASVVMQARSIDVMTRLIRVLADRQTPVTDFRTIVPTLEDVFLKLTGHSVRQ